MGSIRAILAAVALGGALQAQFNGWPIGTASGEPCKPSGCSGIPVLEAYTDPPHEIEPGGRYLLWAVPLGCETHGGIVTFGFVAWEYPIPGTTCYSYVTPEASRCIELGKYLVVEIPNDPAMHGVEILQQVTGWTDQDVFFATNRLGIRIP